ncbi:hypothetical protein GWI33_005841 [Rhynchophorus ferrugineus]|uniref:Uncharacterized protein n=1 Tax=Rhynchophorus ferrugineus TaxID=354439 RepID=A0A834IFS9_RHYFE|nr:hypothetical protein GWI33_005841 [Rhynchophorus ferrugineus]
MSSQHDHRPPESRRKNIHDRKSHDVEASAKSGSRALVKQRPNVKRDIFQSTGNICVRNWHQQSSSENFLGRKSAGQILNLIFDGRESG